MRYIVRGEHRYVPSSSNVAYTSSGDASANRSEHSVSNTVARSASAQGPGGGRTGLLLPGRRPATAVERRPRHTRRHARKLHAHMVRQLFCRSQEFFPRSRLNPGSPATFP